MEEGTQQLVRACDLCSWAETRSGERWQPGGLLVPPTIELERQIRDTCDWRSRSRDQQGPSGQASTMKRFRGSV